MSEPTRRDPKKGIDINCLPKALEDLMIDESHSEWSEEERLSLRQVFTMQFEVGPEEMLEYARSNPAWADRAKRVSEKLQVNRPPIPGLRQETT